MNKVSITSTLTSQNLLANIEKIIELSENSELSNEFFEKAKSNIDYVRNVLQVSDMAALFFSLLVDNAGPMYTHIKELSDHLNCRKIRIMQYQDSFNELEKQRLVRCNRKNTLIEFRIPREVISAITEGRKIEPRKYMNISQDEFLEFLSELFEEKQENEILYKDLTNELLTLIEANPHLELSKQIKKGSYAGEDEILLLYFCHLFANEDDDMVGFHDLDSVFDKKLLRNIKRSFKERDNELITDGLIENCKEEEFLDANYYKLTDKAKQDLFGEDILKGCTAKLDKKFIVFNNINTKKMFFDTYERTQIDKLADLLKPQNFELVQKRLTENGMKNGFACLFYVPY